jgi:hypothetical protein
VKKESTLWRPCWTKRNCSPRRSSFSYLSVIVFYIHLFGWLVCFVLFCLFVVSLFV